MRAPLVALVVSALALPTVAIADPGAGRAVDGGSRFPRPAPSTRTRAIPRANPASGYGVSEGPRTLFDEPTRRGGLTGGLDFGYGITTFALDGASTVAAQGVTGVGAALGAWVSPRLAVLGRVSAATSARADGTRVVNGFLGPAAQVRLGSRGFAGAGLGLALRGQAVDGLTVDPGVGADLRLGVEVEQYEDRTIHLAIEVTPGWYDDGVVTGIGLQLGVDLE